MTVTPISIHPRFRRVAEGTVPKAVMASLLGYSTRWIELRMKEGLPVHRDCNGYARFVPSEVNRWLEKRSA